MNGGTNLTLNYPFMWSSGPVRQPCDALYHGPSALSEPESQHMLSSFAASNAGLVLSLQSPGSSIYYPWAWTQSAASDALSLDALAWNLGRLNSTPRQNVVQYSRGAGATLGGTLEDTAYGQYGVPAFTLNIGATSAPICPELGPLWDTQRPALLYATKAVGLTPASTYSHAFGPTPRDLSVAGSATPDSIQFSAVLSANYSTVAGAVYSIDVPGDDGAGLPMSGNFGGGLANVSAQVDTGALPNGRHLLFVQGRASDGNWGVYSSIFFTVTGNPTSTPSLTPQPPASSTRTSTASPTPPVTITPTTVPATASPTGTPTPSTTPTNTTPTPFCTQVTYVSTEVPRPIPDQGTITSTLVVFQRGFVSDIDVTGLDIRHGWIGGLTVSLSAPSGFTVILFDRVCGHTANIPGIGLDDGASQPISGTCPPAQGGVYRPANPLSLFNGEIPTGRWTLTVTDNAGGDVGVLESWGLSILVGSGCSTPTPSPTMAATGTPTLSPTITRTPTSTRTPAETSTPSYTRTPTDTRVPTESRTATETRTPVQSRTPTPTEPPATITPLPCAYFSDVSSGQYFYAAVNWLTCRHIVSGYTDGTFRPSNPATRAQIVKMVVLGEGWQLSTPSQPTFSDVPQSQPFFAFIETAYEHSIVAGYGDNTFRPYNNVTRGQLSKMIVLARGWPLSDPAAAHFSDVQRGSAFYLFVETAYAHSVLSGYGDNTFRPQLDATRGQLSKMLYVALTQP